MAEGEDKIKEYIADLDRQLIEVDQEIIKAEDDKVKVATLTLKRDQLLKQRASATGERYEDYPSSTK